MYGIAIHGGAGTLPRAQMSAEAEDRYRAGLEEAIEAGFTLLESGGTSLDAVMRAVMLLEDNPLFNAARGAVFTLEGRNELDASIMDGHSLRAGAVCGVTRIRNPVELARAVMDRSEYVMLVGAGAEAFALSNGFSFVPESYFHTPERWKQLERIRRGEAGLSPLTISHIGTVGAVAVDARGRLASATSTGGMTGKRYQRVGDSPIIGAGTYADDRSCAVSATGHGEIFIRAAVAHDICARMRFGGRNIATAVREVVHEELPALGGDGGVIAIDTNATIAIEF
ncbi:MAG TPA: isoaspartyl peptidase/L-asparaginase, partial [Steroidobacteraceae bacterium]